MDDINEELEAERDMEDSQEGDQNDLPVDTVEGEDQADVPEDDEGTGFEERDDPDEDVEYGEPEVMTAEEPKASPAHAPEYLSLAEEVKQLKAVIKFLEGYHFGKAAEVRLQESFPFLKAE